VKWIVPVEVHGEVTPPVEELMKVIMSIMFKADVLTNVSRPGRF